MKFFLSLGIASILLAASVSAQHVNIGIKGGLNVYNINNSNNVEYDGKAGIHAGLLGHVHLSKNIALQPEVFYSMQGTKFTNSGVDTKINLNYINVPLLVQYMFDNGFRLQAGPQVGFLINSKSKTNGVKTDIDYLKPLDFSVGIGGGYVHPPTGVGVDVRYNLGLSNINEGNISNKAKNRGVQLGIFYLFKHK